jgi:hypothetical protein
VVFELKQTLIHYSGIHFERQGTGMPDVGCSAINNQISSQNVLGGQK